MLFTKQRALTSGGLYAAGTATPLRSLEGLRLVGNLRVDTLQYGPAVQPAQASWRGAVSYEFSEDVTAKLFAGRAFQGPSATLLFAVPGSFGFGNQANIIGQYDSMSEASRRHS